MTAKIPDIIREELDNCPYPWSVKRGGIHVKLFIADVLVGIWPHNARKHTTAGRGGLALRSQIRRRIRELEEKDL